MEIHCIETDQGPFYVLHERRLAEGSLKGNLGELAGQELYIGQFLWVRPHQQDNGELPPVPEQLEVIRTNLQDLMDHIYGGNWQNANSSLSVIQLAKSELIPILQEEMVPDELIDSMNLNNHMLEQLLIQRDKEQALYYASQLLNDLADLLDYFQTPFPADLIRMDYMSRQLIFQAENMDWMEASASFSEIHNTWERVRPLLEMEADSQTGENGQEEDRQDAAASRTALLNGVDEAIDQLGIAVSDRNYQNTMDGVELLLERLSELEADLTQQAAPGMGAA
ncbi:hypothetical protein Ami103574_06365 [Aminipila butyrica]|uniref:Uncharacterized protein n=1 Tax=Aminipila butyrica TaxID=433296 RepID=A0A858BTS9_9FIRM|nr:hypothetical protein [Aminipila butyrica]QIB68967.1 hypothetical protein Ami103574_06365 [Aminipila butyrica]